METWSQRLDLRQLADDFGTPLYVNHLPTLERNFRAYAALVGDPGHVRYPVKANPSPVIVERLAALGSGADCASRDEVQVAQSAGIPLTRITYNTPAVNVDLAAWLLRCGASVVADSFEVLDALAALGPAENLAGQLFARVNPGGLPGYRHESEIQKYTSHGSLKSQFGIPSEELPGYLATYPLPVSGLHMHVGTQMDNVETFVAGLAFLHRLADLLAEHTGHRIRTLNLGGGLGIPFADEESFPTIEELAAALAPHLRGGLDYHVEPGNSLVGDAVALLARVAATKNARGRRWAIADVGTDQLVKFTVARWEHQIVDADHRPLPRTGPDALAGPLCFAGDVLLPETSLGDLKTGDPLLVQHAGAYCEAVSSRFNGRRSPAHVVIDGDGEIHQVRRSEDPFFEPVLQSFVAQNGNGKGNGNGNGHAAAERVAPELCEALHSEYMHELANDDHYTLREMSKIGERTYDFTVDTSASVPFVAMPLALRIIGDAAITAVGHELGWRKKAAPVWATRLSMSCGENLPSGGAVPCRIIVGALYPSVQSGKTGVVHYQLGEHGEVRGVARVVAAE